MSMFDDAKKQAEQAMEEHPDQVEKMSDTGLDRASEAAGSATGGRFDEQIQQGRNLADERIGNNTDTTNEANDGTGDTPDVGAADRADG